MSVTGNPKLFRPVDDAERRAELVADCIKAGYSPDEAERAANRIIRAMPGLATGRFCGSFQRVSERRTAPVAIKQQQEFLTSVPR
jgi:plasmid stabilization system protein ParE